MSKQMYDKDPLKAYLAGIGCGIMICVIAYGFFRAATSHAATPGSPIGPSEVHVSEAPYTVEVLPEPAPVEDAWTDASSVAARNLEELLTWPSPEPGTLDEPSKDHSPAPEHRQVLTYQPKPSPFRRAVAFPFSAAAQCVTPVRHISTSAHGALRGALLWTGNSIDNALSCVQCALVDANKRIRGEQ